MNYDEPQDQDLEEEFPQECNCVLPEHICDACRKQSADDDIPF